MLPTNAFRQIPNLHGFTHGVDATLHNHYLSPSQKDLSGVNHQLIELSALAAITVTYHPDHPLLLRQMEGIPKELLWIVVDNGSSSADIAFIENLVRERPKAKLIANGKNLGLPAALNTGVQHAINQQKDFVLLLDQDSVPHQFAIEKLLQTLLKIENATNKTGCVGPVLIDETTGLQHGFHIIRHGMWKRTYVDKTTIQPIKCQSLNGSGTLTRTALYTELNGLDESLFIDHVDTDWAFRVTASGHWLFGAPQAIFDHNMGQSSLKFWFFGQRIWPYRSPLRHYFLFRNTLRLMRKPYIPMLWKFWAVIKLTLTLSVHFLFDTKHRDQIKMMLRGIYDGINPSHGSKRQRNES